MTETENIINNDYQEQLRQHEAGLADHSQRIAALEDLIRNTPESQSIRTSPPPEFVPYVSIRSSQWQEVTQEIIDVRDELEVLRSKWAAIPWDEIAHCANTIIEDRETNCTNDAITVEEWVNANEPHVGYA